MNYFEKELLHKGPAMLQLFSDYLWSISDLRENAILKKQI